MWNIDFGAYMNVLILLAPISALILFAILLVDGVYQYIKGFNRNSQSKCADCEFDCVQGRNCKDDK